MALADRTPLRRTIPTSYFPGLAQISPLAKNLGSGSTTTTTAPSSGQTAPVYGQCGGEGWTGPTVCASGSTCVVSNECKCYFIKMRDFWYVPANIKLRVLPVHPVVDTSELSCGLGVQAPSVFDTCSWNMSGAFSHLQYELSEINGHGVPNPPLSKAVDVIVIGKTTRL